MAVRRLITIYDCRLSLDWSGTASDGTEVLGSLTIPEVSHENTVDGLSEYVVCRPFMHVLTSDRTTLIFHSF